MLVIRREQLRVLSQITRKAFESRMVTHLGKHFAQTTEALGDEQLRETIRHGMDRAEDHGFRSDRDVSRYLNLMFTFGREFDTDRALTWAADLLQEDAPASMNQLYAAGIEHLDAARGLRASQ